MHSNDGELAVLTAIAKPRLARVAVTALATRDYASVVYGLVVRSAAIVIASHIVADRRY